MLLTSLSKHSVQISRGKVTWTWQGGGGKLQNKSKGMQNAVPLCQYNNKTNDQHFICMFILQVIICIYLSLQEIKQTFVSLYLVFSLFHTAFVKKFNPPCHVPVTLPHEICTECFERLVNNILRGDKMLHFAFLFVFLF
jgi:hypothetical protein